MWKKVATTTSFGKSGIVEERNRFVRLIVIGATSDGFGSQVERTYKRGLKCGWASSLANTSLM